MALNRIRKTIGSGGRGGGPGGGPPDGGGANDNSAGPIIGLELPPEAPQGSFVTGSLRLLGESIGVVAPSNDSANLPPVGGLVDVEGSGHPGRPVNGGGGMAAREGNDDAAGGGGIHVGGGGGGGPVAGRNHREYDDVGVRGSVGGHGGVAMRGSVGGQGGVAVHGSVGGQGGAMNHVPFRPHIIEGGYPGHITVQQPNHFEREQETRHLLMRAQSSEEAHMYDTQQLYHFLKNQGAKPKRNQPIVQQVVNFCTDILQDYTASAIDIRNSQRERNDAIAETSRLQKALNDALGRLNNSRAETEQYRSKYINTKDKLDKADGKRKDAVANVMREINGLTKKHEYEKAKEQAELRQQISQLKKDMTTLASKHEIDKARLEGDHEVKLASLEEKHKEALKQQHAENERIIDEIIDSHDAELQVYNSKVRELASDLISQSDDFRPATDQGLSMKLLDLRNRIKNITVPNNLQIRTASVPSLPGNDGTATGGLDGAGGGAADTTAAAAGIHHLPADLDPTGFIARHGSRDIQYILRGLVWKALIEAFFSAPFGFGFLGSDASGNQGRRQLLEIHRSWSRLYEGGHHQHPYRGDELGMYSHDPYANKMRSALFQSFLPAVYPDKASRNNNKGPNNSSQQDLHQGLHHQQLPQHPLQPTVPEDMLAGRHDNSDPSNPMWPGQFQAFQPGGGSAGPPVPPPRRTFGSFMSITSVGSSATAVSSSTGAGPGASAEIGVAMLYRQHCDNVIIHIRQLLDRITNNNTRPDAHEAVSTIVNLAAELGLECGVQRAQIWLLIPKPNEIVTLGAEYADCLGAASGNGDSERGRDVKVDIVVSPGIVRIGDGRRDMTVRKALVPCEVFPFMNDGM